MSYLKIYPKRIIATQNADGVFGYGNEISLDSGLPAECQVLLSDPQTSGGLLVSCSAETVPEVMAVFKRHGFEDAAVVGHIGGLQNAHLIVN